MRRRAGLGLAASMLASLLLCGATAVATPPPPSQDPFYTYDGSTPLAQLAPGTVLKTRTTSVHIAGIPLPINAVQLLYRSTGQQGQATVNVTSVLRPPLALGPAKLVSYQSFYDTLDPDDEPSYAIFGGPLLPSNLIAQIDPVVTAPLLLAGYSVAIPDTEGQAADLGAGPEYGMNTLDGLRAVAASPATGISPTTKVGLLGYSGGAIATGWAAQMAPSYAPDVNPRIVGAAMGGVLVHMMHNTHYADGTLLWAGATPLTLIGVSRAFGFDLSPYLSTYGAEILARLQKATVLDVIGQYPGLTWAQLFKPQYSEPEDVPEFVDAVNQMILSRDGAPTAPLLIAQGAGGALTGAPGDKPGIGPGDGVMVAGDVRTLARTYCAAGTRVLYHQYDLLDHLAALEPWRLAAQTWLLARFTGATAPQNCAAIAPGNPLDPIPEG